MAPESDNRFDLTESVCRDFKFNWIIPDFRNASGGELCSPLSSSDKSNVKLKLILKVTPGSSNKFKIGLSKTHSEPQDFCVFFAFKIFNFHGESLCKESLEFMLSQNGQEWFSREITRLTIPIAEHPFRRHLHYVTISGHIVLKECCSTIETDLKSTDEAVAQLQQDFYEFLQSGEAADITLSVASDIFKVHKFVLCARSPVFRRMFTSDMIEKRENKVRINNINSAVFKIFLTFLYTGEIGQPTFCEVCELYSVSDIYEVLTLQKSCRSILISYLSGNTVSGILELADSHHDHELEETAVKFICDNFKIVSETAEWKTLINTSPRLASFTLQKVSQNLSMI